MVAGQVDGVDPEAFKIIDGKLYLRWAKQDVKKWADKGIAEMRKDIKKADANWAKIQQFGEDGVKLPIPKNRKIFLQIGKMDKKSSEFKAYGFRGVEEFICTAKIDCDVEAFPCMLYRMSEVQRFDRIAPINRFDDSGVAQVTINFTLHQNYEKVVLRMVRPGAETTVVTVDGKQKHLVTNTMLGSIESHAGVGAYNLILGPLNKDTHSIQLTVAEDGVGNGRHYWDALTLYTE